MSDELFAPAPEITPDTEVFWDATLRGELLVQACADCGLTYFYPRPRCPACLGDHPSWVEASGRGTVYTYAVVRQAGGEFSAHVPYVLAYVELEEGPRMMTNVVGCDPDELAVGQPVEVVFHDTAAEAALPRFRPVRG